MPGTFEVEGKVGLARAECLVQGTGSNPDDESSASTVLEGVDVDV